jgi:hypothetical protein
MSITLQCISCGSNFEITPARKDLAKFCSRKCMGLHTSKVRVGENHPNYVELEDRSCLGCGSVFKVRPKVKKKFCERKCYWKYNKGELHASWNGGKIKRRCAVCQKEFSFFPSQKEIRKTCSFKCTGIFHSINYSGENHPLHIERVKKNCLWCDKEIFVLPRKIEKQNFCSKSCKAKWYRKEVGSNGCFGLRGEEHPFWIPELNREYSSKFKKQLKEEVKERFERCCALCHRTEEQIEKAKHKLCIHHIDYDKHNCSMKNLLPLCSICHGKTSSKRKSYTKFLQDFVTVINNNVIGV